MLIHVPKHVALARAEAERAREQGWSDETRTLRECLRRICRGQGHESVVWQVQQTLVWLDAPDAGKGKQTATPPLSPDDALLNWARRVRHQGDGFIRSELHAALWWLADQDNGGEATLRVAAYDVCCGRRELVYWNR